MIRLLVLLLLAACPVVFADPLAAVPTVAHRVVERRAHDPTLFTQGMSFYGEQLLESGGNYRASRLLLRGLDAVPPVLQVALPRTWFAEGVAVLGERALLLTWQEGIAQEFTLPALQRTRQFRYRGDGWGLTTDGSRWIMSDGSNRLVWRGTADFREQRSVRVRAGGRPVERLNELEWVEGWILANILASDAVVAIDPADGRVAWKLELGGLLEESERARADVLNGLAWQPSRRLLWASGKEWPWMFALELKIPPRPAAPAPDPG